MSSRLWKAYYDDDLEAFQRALHALSSSLAPGISSTATHIGSPGTPSVLGSTPVASRFRGPQHGPGRAEFNWRDASGQTLLHHVASSRADSAEHFAALLIEHPLCDLYVQDYESGWTALHRAFYFGNVTVARMILERDAADAWGKMTGYAHQTVGLVKVKDREGLGPLDLFAATIKDRTLRPDVGRARSGSMGSEDEKVMLGDGEGMDSAVAIPATNVKCDQLYTFGSNKNVTLGFGDEDDRQFPERIGIRRPEHLLRRFYAEHLEREERKWSAHDPNFKPKNVDLAEMWVEDIPWMARGTPLIVQDVQMSKLHSAVITADPECNLYLCGHGQGGRLGVGDERTRFNFVCVEGGALAGKRVATVALGLNHTLALSSDGDIFSWGNNAFGQLGYSLPRSPTNDDDPISLLPRQIFGVLKREVVIGVAASRIHSVAHTETSLYTFGKNEGQLGIMDSDARSLEVQTTPRKVAAALFASPIIAVSAMDRATVCLLDNHEVWVFANYGYAKVQFPLEGFTNYFLKQSFLVTTYDHEPNRIVKLTCGGDTICALSSRGEIYTLSITQRVIENQASASTTNPAKIKSAIPAPQRIWSPRKSNMAARDVGVDADGSIILSTEEGSVWKRTKRATIKDASAAGTAEYKPKDYKFSRIPGLTRVLAVRASAYGAYAAVRRDCDVTQTQIVVEDPTLWHDLFQMLPLRHSSLGIAAEAESDSEMRPRFWQPHRATSELQKFKRAVLACKDVEAELAELASSVFADPGSKCDAVVCTTTSDVRIPLHRFVLTGRSRVLRRGFRDLCETSTFTIPDLAVSELDADGRVVVRFQGLDILTLVDLVLYLYTDGVVDFWHFSRNAPEMAHRHRQVRTELMKVATKLDLAKLESAARMQVEPKACLDMDFEVAFRDPAFFHDGDIVVRLEDDEVRVHSALVCARCPFFEGLFMGRAGGRWLAGREQEEAISVDLEDINARTFALVLRHLYADTGVELFDDVVSVGVDDFLDFVMDVMSAANELMLDRLSQICQQVIGRFVNVRNVCGLLNAISPSSVHEFKDAALEYLCLSLEAMLQGHHLNELDEDLLAELDSVVQENQLACMPFAKSGRAELDLHERHPELAAVLERSRQAKVDAIALRSKFHDLGSFAIGSVEDEASPLQQKGRRRSSNIVKHEPETPALRSRASAKDMLFAMDEEFDENSKSPGLSPSIRPMPARGLTDHLHSSSPPAEEVWYDSRGKILPSPRLGPQTGTPLSGVTPRTPRSPNVTGKTPPSGVQPWSLTPLPGPRSDMRDIMAQAATTTRTSTLSQGLAASDILATSTAAPFSLPGPKMSQKDRKRIQRSTTTSPSVEPKSSSPATATTAKPAAWQTVGGRSASSIKDILQKADDVLPKPANARTSSTPQLTMRQTVANTKPGASNLVSSTPPQPASPFGGARGGTPARASTPGAAATAHPLSPATLQPALQSPRPPSATPRSPVPPPQSQSHSKPIPQSIRHGPPPVDPSMFGLSMSEIVAAQQLEKDVVREAAAKRDLQEIQAEQEFEEWWQRESARVQEAEKRGSGRQAAGGAGAGGEAGKKPRRKVGNAGRKGKGKGDEAGSQGEEGVKRKGKRGGGSAGGGDTAAKQGHPSAGDARPEQGKGLAA